MAQSRQLAAIMFTDIVGYTAFMEQDEKRALDLLKKNLSIHHSVINELNGRLIKELGDGILASFSTVSDALNAAIKIQHLCNATNEFKLRISIHQGEVLFENGDIFGDAVNVASRIQSLGVPGSILFSKKVTDELKNKTEFQTISIGSFEFKNIHEPIEVFALANEGFPVPKRSRIENKPTEENSNQKRNVLIGFSIILFVASVLFVYKMFLSNNDTTEVVDKSIAVLPFVNMSNDPEQEYFSDGMTDQIITNLAKLKVLDVIGRTSMMHYKGSLKTLPEIAKELNNVSYILEGSIQKSGNRIKINAQLIRSKDGFHRWAEVYDRDLTDIFAVQDELSAKIAQALLGELQSDQKALIKTDQPANVEAYEYYLKGIHFHFDLFARNTTMEDFLLAEQMFLKAISFDPAYASAYGALADLYDTRGNDPAYRKSWNLRDSVVRIGYKINPKSAYVLLSLGLTYSKRLNPNLDSAYYYFRDAYKIDSDNPIINSSFGATLIEMGLFEKAEPLLKKALLLDPLNRLAREGMAKVQFSLGDIASSEENYKKLLEIDKDNLWAQATLALISFFYRGDLDETKKWYQTLLKTNSENYHTKAVGSWLLAKEGKKEDALKMFRSIPTYSILNMKKEAIQVIDSNTGIDTNSFYFSYLNMKNDKAFDFVRSEPEFQVILLHAKKIYEERLAKYGHMFE